MNCLADAHHSAQGHTAHIASLVADGARCLPKTEVDLLKAEDMAKVPDQLNKYDGLSCSARRPTSAAPDSFVAGDLRTARMFGRNFAEMLARVGVAA